MDNQIVCPYCKKSIPLTQALSHQIQEKYQKFFKIRLEEEKKKLEAEVKEIQYKKIKAEMEFQFKDKANENQELKKQNQTLQEQLLELNRLMRQVRNENEQKKLEYEKKIIAEQEKISYEIKKRIVEENRLKFLEYEKKILDISKVKEDLERKLEQRSQQLQGEVLELELEKILSSEFPYDEILPVPKGVRGADVIQIVKNNGKICGKIVWETKRTKAWNDDWIVKLKEDQRQIKAEIAVLISNILPEGIKNFSLLNDICVGNYDSILGLSLILRTKLIELTSAKIANVGKSEKLEILHQYITGIEFKQRVEAIIEAFSTLQDELEKEKRWFASKWARQEKSIRKVIDHTLGMHGDLQSIMGKTLSDIKGFEMLPVGNTEKTLF